MSLNEEVVLEALASSKWYTPRLYKYTKNVWLLLGDNEITVSRFAYIGQPDKGLTVAISNAKIEKALEGVPDILEEIRVGCALNKSAELYDLKEEPYYDLE